MPKKIKIGRAIITPVVSDDGKTISFKAPQGTTYTKAEFTDIKNAGFVYSAGAGMKAPNTRAAQDFLRSYAVDKAAAPAANAATEKADKQKAESRENKKAPAKKAAAKKKEAGDNGKEKQSNSDRTDTGRVSEPEKNAADNAEQKAGEPGQDQDTNRKAEKVESGENKKAVSVEENIANGKKAIQKVIDTHEDVENAMYREDVGNIDFVWGEEGRGAKFKGGYGIAHIIAKRNSENGSGIETINKLVEVIAKGKDKERQESDNDNGEPRLKIHYDGYTAVLSLKDTDKNTWLLTGWEDSRNNKEATVSANGEGYDSTIATAVTPTLTRRNGETAASINSISQEAKSSNRQSKKTRRQARHELKTALDKIMEAAKQAKLPQKIAGAWRSLLKARAIAYDPYDPARMFEEHPLLVRSNTKAFADYAQSAWHGSPYKFDKFDLGKIGTGEGNQAHGWGLYFAKDRKISEGYQNRLSWGKFRNETLMFDEEKLLKEYEKQERVARRTSSELDYEKLALLEDLLAAHDESSLNDPDVEINPKVRAWYEKNIRNKVLNKNRKNGSLIEVEIPNEDTMLDEGKSFEEQPPKVREAIRKLNLKHEPEHYYVVEHEGKEYRILKSKVELRNQISDHPWIGADGVKLSFTNVPHLQQISGSLWKKYVAARKAYKALVTALNNKLEEELRQGTVQTVTVEKPITDDIGGDIYELAEKKYGSSKAASEALNSVGIKGITYDGVQDGRCYVVFDDKAVKIIETYNQKMNDALKGAFSARDNESVITFFEGKDATTVIHETGHYFVDMLAKIVKAGQATEQQVADWNALLKYGGMTQEEWDAADVKGRTGMHERCAEAFETYLMEGKAPTRELTRVFQQFKEWLLNVYRAAMSSLRNGNAIELTDDVRRVFDHMFTSEEREQMQLIREMLETVTAEEADENSAAEQTAETSVKSEPAKEAEKPAENASKISEETETKSEPTQDAKAETAKAAENTAAKEPAPEKAPAPKAAVKKPKPDKNGVVPIYANNHNRYFEGEELEKVRAANTEAIMKAAQAIADKYDQGELPASDAKAQITALYKRYYSKAKVKPYTDDLQEQINELRKEIAAKEKEKAKQQKTQKQQKPGKKPKKPKRRKMLRKILWAKLPKLLRAIPANWKNWTIKRAKPLTKL